MTALHETLRRYVADRAVPGAVALLARGDDVEVVTVGHVDADGSAPMARDSLFRIASITKPVTAAAVLMLVEEGLAGLDDPVDTWLPELAKPMAVRTPSGPLDDLVPAARPITVEDLLSSRTGWGFPSDFSLPAVQALFAVQKDGRYPQAYPAPDVWLAGLAQVPLLYQPGEAWLYGTSSDLQGVLVARASGRTLPEFLAERVFEPLGMKDTAFEVPADRRDRFTTSYRPGPDGTLEVADTPDGEWSRLPAFPSGGGGLVSTADDWLAFARMLLGAGEANGRRLLSPTSVSRMTSNHLSARQREIGRLFLGGQGWGYGAQVDVTPAEPWNVPGRYGWVGGTGTTAHLVPATGTVALLLTQVAMADPTPTPLMRDFWRVTA
ncbi:CubicO group peptidase (beta-lactamase class C family) [Streptomyces griseochromogenes]|uniref:CubicO group peptidase (Beta-lactamase class C family) n=1 Tax=Streptomyces griseochromogenes TaxID=68214 RepID=A0A1B1B7Z0_9ACTN|nr:serine hydrolase domain-containing protein [Streptomyces griseochromogenes]ANP54901.1 serine hydrolase [Streptomyces griseochromogenes]MBP2048508.1 CubicO group peptidase (beta-lactamase class C family) [Streptomyces griseochromogenes]